MTRALVTGSRNITDFFLVFDAMDLAAMKFGISEICHGACRGADRLSGDWARKRGILCREYPADWLAHGKKAGPIRNAEMIEDFVPNICLSFGGSTGTLDMMRKAAKAKVPVWLWDGDKWKEWWL